MKKLPEFLSKLREPEKVETMGAHRPTAARCVFRAVGSARAQRRGRCRIGAVRCGCVFRGGRRQRGGQARSEGAMRRGSRRESRGGCVFQQGVARRTAGAVRVPEGSGGEVNAVGTAVRALVEAPVGFEKALEGIGCGEGGVGRGGGVRGEYVGRGAGGDGRRESGGGEHRAERGDRGEEKRRNGAAASARGAVAGGSEGVFWPGTGRGWAQRSNSTSTTGRVWRLKVLPLPSLMGITVAR